MVIVKKNSIWIQKSHLLMHIHRENLRKMSDDDSLINDWDPIVCISLLDPMSSICQIIFVLNIEKLPIFYILHRRLLNGCGNRIVRRRNHNWKCNNCWNRPEIFDNQSRKHLLIKTSKKRTY